LRRSIRGPETPRVSVADVEGESAERWV